MSLQGSFPNVCTNGRVDMPTRTISIVLEPRVFESALGVSRQQRTIDEQTRGMAYDELLKWLLARDPHAQVSQSRDSIKVLVTPLIQIRAATDVISELENVEIRPAWVAATVPRVWMQAYFPVDELT